eukprot:CAMPEP_0118680992 /NCGR_PEP_ID=MMETSP0800-20121206/4687_1 /TAXON_ID=210618 ORGANISM="Striatella unipunctata, Strain CCMP2910" /NCGR_SAMPLE_ID=MMETSP0800 /ASSEMBLY_ACC=CAM_ASM_000638 /LENGTH=222 /DNA_ID=CAMNT_0006577231 /DNA_START=135 /DNA_END=803 /DNA_ORIENTATION=+
MAMDYNDPVVAEEFGKVQPMSFEEVEEELNSKGILAPPMMNEMDVKLMLVEVRLRLSGRMPGNSGGSTPRKKPDKFASKLEEALWTKPALKELYDGFRSREDINSMNVVAEYVNAKEMAITRYGKDYADLIKSVDEALTAPPPVKSPTLSFSGFPANMGEEACKMTFAALGEVVEFECAASDELPILSGKVTFEDIEAAKKAVAQYDGMDMGMGTALEIASV